MYSIPVIFCDFEKDIDAYMFDVNFLILITQSSALSLCNYKIRIRAY